MGSISRDDLSLPGGDEAEGIGTEGRRLAAVAPRGRRWSRAASAAIALLGLVVVSVVSIVVLDPEAPARWLIVQDPLERADAALVLTGDVDYERTIAAARLVETGYARILVVTGGEPSPGDSAQSLRDRAIREGVPPTLIRMESTSAGTWESLVAVAPILRAEGIHSVLLVTSPYHQRRASMAARKALPGLRIISRPAPSEHWTPESWWKSPIGRAILVKEYFKIGYYILRGWA